MADTGRERETLILNQAAATSPVVTTKIFLSAVSICFSLWAFPQPAIIEHMMILRPETAERKISIRVFLRLTRMDVCCGPPTSR
jgi:hypothetical protein